jgi:hypothetical protein
MNRGSLKYSALRLPHLPLYKQAFINTFFYRIQNLSQKRLEGEAYEISQKRLEGEAYEMRQYANN